VQFFGALLDNTDESELDPEERKAREIASLILKIKNGTPPQRKASLKQITERVRVDELLVCSLGLTITSHLSGARIRSQSAV
jgi:hypothetical protein